MPASRLHPLLRMVLCAIGLFVVVSIVQAVGMGVLLAFSKQLGVADLPPAQRVLRVATNYALYLTVFSYPLGLAVLYFFRTRVDKYSWRSLGFARERAWPNFLRGAFTALLTLSVLFSLMWVAGAIRFAGWSSDVQTHSAAYALVALLGYGLAFGAVGFFEETVFRGYGLANLRQWLGWPAAVIVQAAVFAAVHLMNGALDPAVFKAVVAGLPNLFLIAVFFALSYRKTGSLWFPIGFHIAWNWLLGCVFSLPVSGIPTFRLFEIQNTGTSFLSGGLFGAEGSFFLVPLVLAMIYALWLVPDHPRALANLDAPESSLAPTPDYAPAETSYLSSLTSRNDAEETEDAEDRTNRYNARFGSAQGFDSDMLRELKQMQEARDQAERERLETERSARRAEELRLEEIRRAQIAAQANAVVREQTPVATEETPAVTTATTPTQEPVTATTSEVIAPATEAQEMAVAPAAPVVLTPPTAPVAPTPTEEALTTEPPKPTRRSLEPRRPAAPKVPATPPAPAPQQTSPAPTATPTQTATAPNEETAPTTPAPPKKSRPRW